VRDSTWAMARARRLRICTGLVKGPVSLAVLRGWASDLLLHWGTHEKISLAELFTFLELLDFARPTRSPPPSYRDITHVTHDQAHDHTLLYRSVA
jgi:hypothetical protein